MLKVALVYDWVDTNYGGAENVLLALHELYPQAPLYTSFADETRAKWLKKFPVVKTSFIQSWPRFLWRHKALLAPFLPRAFEAFDFGEFELIISLTTFAAKGCRTQEGQIHLCHLLTPTRFLYSHQQTYLGRLGGVLLAPVLNYLRRWDQRAIKRPDLIFVNSKLVARRCEKFYGRRPDGVLYSVILPPNLRPQKGVKKSFFLCVGRLVPYKKIKDVVSACGQKNYPLVVIGTGSELGKLQRLVKKHRWSKIKFLGHLPTAKLATYYNQAWALVAPGLEDFGMNLIEANACGTYVITHPKSGGREVLSAKMAFDLLGPTEADLEETLDRCYRQAQKQPQAPRANLRQYEFKAAFGAIVKKHRLAFSRG